MPYWFRSIRSRIILASFVLLSLLLVSALYTQQLVRQSSQSYSKRLENVARLSELLHDLKVVLRGIEGQLYRYASSQSEEQRTAVLRLLEQGRQKMTYLQGSGFVRMANDVHSNLEALAQSYHQLDFAVRGVVRLVEEKNALIEAVENAPFEQHTPWLADMSVIRQYVQAHIEGLNDLTHRIDQYSNRMNAKSLSEVMSTADLLSRFLWLYLLLASISLLAGYYVFERVLRSPLLQVGDALNALARGEGYTPILPVLTSETDALLRSFREMQSQVTLRETRLSAILNNAGESILTISDSGYIETVNRAAERLFAYARHEVIGKHVSLLMPELLGYVQQPFRHYLEDRSMGQAFNALGRRKDGSEVHISLNITEMFVDGQFIYTAIVEDISERKQMLEHLRYMAEHDSLTELYNRQYLLDQLECLLARASSEGRVQASLLYLDLDNFKYVNDTLGHLAGDKVLIDVARILMTSSDTHTTLVRLGGDEFAVLLTDVGPEASMTIAESYRLKIADYVFQHNGKYIDVGCSIGVTMIDGSEKSHEQIMAHADIACHMAKRDGRNSVHLFHDDDQVKMDNIYADMGWAKTIKSAIDNDQLVLALQPIMHATSHKAFTYEVLLRMHTDDKELLYPASFIPLAERFGLMLDIDRWVIRKTMALVAKLEKQNCLTPVSINLSAQTISDEHTLNYIVGFIKQYGLNPSLITFEITETVAIADLDSAGEFMDKLRRLGCKTALDDFGVGYCSFAYLKDLPADYIKIDGSFVVDIDKDALHLAMVKSMNDIAHAMGKETVAEYVEAPGVLELLKEIGVDYVQGNLIGRPKDLLGTEPATLAILQGDDNIYLPSMLS